MNRFQLLPHQSIGISFLRDRERAYLADDMGLGKTRQAIEASVGFKKVLVVCPSIALLSWVKEIPKWSNEKCEILDRKTRRSLVKWDLISYGNLRSSGIFDPSIYDLLIIDEAHMIKNPATKSFKSVYNLTKRIKRCWLLSGTPIRNNLSEFYTSALICKIYSGSYPEWKNSFCNIIFEDIWARGGRRVRVEKIIGNKNIPIFKQLISSILLRRKKEEVLPDLPELVWQPFYVDVDTSTQISEEQYRALIESAKESKQPKDVHLMVLRREVAMKKVSAVISYLRDYIDSTSEPIVVFCNHVDPLQTIVQNFPGQARYIGGSVPLAERTLIEKEFQLGRIPILACQTISGGVSLTLTAARTCLFIDLDWVPANNAQARDRLRRIGQTRAVLAQYVVARDRVDDTVMGILARKTRELEEVLL